jgi:hypothetical protein
VKEEELSSGYRTTSPTLELLGVSEEANVVGTKTGSGDSFVDESVVNDVVGKGVVEVVKIVGSAGQ